MLIQPFRKGAIGAMLFMTAVVTAGTARAGIVVDVINVAGGGLGDVGINALFANNPNNDNDAAPFDNQINIDKRFDAVAEIDILFKVQNSGGTTEYFVDDFVTNNTAFDWVDYHFELGYGKGGDFIPSNLSDSLDFDTPDRDPTPAATMFTLTTHEPDRLWWDGFLPPQGSDAFQVYIDVPDLSNEVPEEFRLPDGYLFTLRQIPTIPEPATFALLGLGSLILTRRSRR